MTDHEELADFLATGGENIEIVATLLSHQLSDNPARLTSQMREIESWYGTMTTTLAELNGILDRAEVVHMPVKGAGTDLDRKAGLAAAVSKERALRDKVSGFVDAIKNRCIVAMHLNKANEAERNVGSRNQT